MKRFVWIFAILAMTTAGCGGIEWFPETKKSDTTPDAFSFTPATVTGVETDSLQTSNTITITGIPSGSAPISVSGDASSEYSLDGGVTFTSAAGTVKNDDTVIVQHFASADFLTTVTTTLTIGDVSATFSSRTAEFTLTPSSFTSQTGKTVGELVTSEAVTITGVKASYTISLSNPLPRTDLYSLDNGVTFTSIPDVVLDGQTITLRHFAAETPNTSVTTSLIIDGAAVATFTSTTGL